jgi:hypothetical protein
VPSTVGAIACTSALQRTNAITQSTLLAEAFSSLIPAMLDRSEAKSEGASLISTVIPGLIRNFRTTPDGFMSVVSLKDWLLKNSE